MSKKELLFLVGKGVVCLGFSPLLSIFLGKEFMVSLYSCILIFFIVMYFMLWNTRYPKSVTESPFFKNKKVMFIVPHPDDELNVAGGVIQNYIDNCSEVFIVFTTNFDTYGKCEAEKRYKEIRKLYKYLGVDREHLFYMGFGATHVRKKEGVLSYNSDNICKSISGHDMTYGIFDSNTVPQIIYGKEVNYDYWAFAGVLRDIILQIKPDDIYCVDYDIHLDHRIASIAFEDVMESIIRESRLYVPNIFKGFAYATSWSTYKDFYNEQYRIDGVKYCNNSSSYINHFNWEERVRLPYLNANQLGVTLRSCNLYKLYSFYKSQNALTHANQTINADQVFWKLPTENCLYGAKVEVSSGREEGLFSIKQLFIDDFNDKEPKVLAGGVTFEKQDKKKFIHFILDAEIEFRSLKIILDENYKFIKNIKVKDSQKGVELFYSSINNNSEFVNIEFGQVISTSDLIICFELYMEIELTVRRVIAANISRPIVLKISSLNKEYMYCDMEGVGQYCIVDEYGIVREINSFITVSVKDHKGKTLPYEIINQHIIKLPSIKGKIYLSIKGLDIYSGLSDSIVICRINLVSRYIISKLVLFEKFIDAILTRIRSIIYDKNHPEY